MISSEYSRGIDMFWNKKPKETAEACVWFSYTVMLPENDEDDNEVTVIGNMIIKNTGTSVLNTPMICIRIKPPEDVRLGVHLYNPMFLNIQLHLNMLFYKRY